MTELVIPSIEPLSREYETLLAESRGIVQLSDAATYTLAGNIKRKLSGRRLAIVEFFKPIKQSLDAHKKTILDRERLVSEPIMSEESRIGGLLVAYDDEQERQRLILQKKAQEEAQLAEAQLHEQLGDAKAADEALNGNGLAQVQVQKATPKVEGLAFRENWSAEVTDLMALIRAVADGKAPVAYLQANSVALNGAARAIKGELNKVPGVKAVMSKTSIGSR